MSPELLDFHQITYLLITMKGYQKKKSVAHDKANNKGFVYIQAGALKGRKLDVLDAVGLRPIGSRTKETFFNWVQFDIQGRDVLDLFAGTGSLGFEAVSRGANSVVLFEYNPQVCNQLKQNASRLNLAECQKAFGVTPQINIFNTDSYKQIKTKATKSYSMVFVDPPFMQENELEVLDDLANNGYLVDEALVFLQLDATYEGLINSINPSYRKEKFKKIGNVLLYLLSYHPKKSDSSTTKNSANSEFVVVG